MQCIESSVRKSAVSSALKKVHWFHKNVSAPQVKQQWPTVSCASPSNNNPTFDDIRRSTF